MLASIKLSLLSMAMVLAPPQEKEVKSDPVAVDFMMNAETLLYSPVREGLQTISFSRPLNTHIGKLGEEKYYFKAPDRFGYALEMDESDPQVQTIKDLLTTQMPQRELQASDTLSMYLGTFITHKMDHYTVRFLDRSEDKVRIRCQVKPKSPLAQFVHARDLIFDPDGLIQSIKIIDAKGTSQTVKIFLKQMEDDGLYLLDRLELETPTEQGPLKSVQSFIYDKIEGYHLVIRTEVSFPEMKSEIELETSQVKVNKPLKDSVFKKPEVEE